MYFNLKLAILVVCCGLAMADLLEKEREFEQKMQSLVLKARGGSAGSSASSLKCLNYYLEQLDELTQEFTKKFMQCEANAKAAMEKLERTKDGELKEIEKCSSKACKRLRECEKLDCALKQLECYTEAGADNSKIMFDISKDAAASAADLNHKHLMIENEKYKCTNATERTYMEEANELYEDLNKCIRGLQTVPTKKPTLPTHPTHPTSRPTTKTTTVTLRTITSPPPTPKISSESNEDDLSYKINDIFSKLKNKFF